METLTGKVALITGASSGIGAGTAVELARRGAKVSLTARRRDKLEETADSCRQAGCSADDVLVVPADILLEDDVERMIDATVEKFGRLDILVNSAGTLKTGNLEKMSMTDLDLMYNINVRSLVHVTQLALRHLQETKGNIVNVSSLTSMRPHYQAIAYSLSKAAVDNFSQALAVEMAPKGVRVNTVNPTYIWTDLYQNFVPEKDYPIFMGRMDTTHPMQRIAKVEEVARTIAHLASPDASYLTGLNLPLDGAKMHTTMSPTKAHPVGHEQKQ